MKHLDKIHEILSGEQIIPQDYKTCNKWSEDMGTSRAHTMNLIRKLIIKGRCDVKHFKLKNISGNYAPIPHYRIKL